MNQKLRDIKTLELEFAKISAIWEHEDGNPYVCVHLARRELALVKSIAKRHGFKMEYNLISYECGEWWAEDEFSEDDFENDNVTADNYGKADAVAFDLKENLVRYMLKSKSRRFSYLRR